MKRVIRLAALTGTLALLAGCAATPEVAPTPTEKPKVYVTAPLTGIKFEEGTNKFLAGPSVACKIDNLDVARPQAGIDRADIVFDEMVEGGLTRFVAVFHSDLPNAVGPVRSIRPMDPDIISPLGGIVCYSGGQLKFVNMMRATDVYNASETAEQGKGTFSRDKTRTAPHNVIVDVAKLAGAHPDLAAPAGMFDFAADAATATAVTDGVEVLSFKAYYPSALAEWTWSASSWVRKQDGKVHESVGAGQLKADNVVVMRMKIDHQYGKVPKTVMVGSGPVSVFTGGKVVEGTWSKTNQTAPIVLTDAKGMRIKLAPGKTWVELNPVKAEGGNLKVTLAPKPKPTPTN